MSDPEAGNFLRLDDDPVGEPVPLISEHELEDLNSARARDGLQPLSHKEAQAELLEQLGISNLDIYDDRN